MPDKIMDSPAPASQPRPHQTEPNQARHDDGITNPRDGRGPLRRCDDQAAKLPLRPPH
jgi:hypothetical protein